MMGTHHDRWTHWGDIGDTVKQWAVVVGVVFVLAALIICGAFLLFGSEV